jgi:TolB-like protein
MLGPVLISSLLLAAPHKPRVVVLDIHDIGGHDGSTAEVLTQVTASEVVSLNKFEVITKQVVSDVLGLERQRQLLGCTESNCMAEIGAALGADFILSGQLGRLGTQFRFDLTLIDARRSRVAAQAGGFEKNEGALGQSVASKTRKLFVDAKLIEETEAVAIAVTPEVSAEPASTSHSGAYVGFGVAGALGIGAGIMTGLAIKNYGTLKPGQTEAGHNQLTQARIADALWAGAILSGAVGTYLYVSAAPGPAGSGGEIGVGGSF